MEEQKDIFDFIEKRKVKTPEKSYFENLSKQIIDSQKPQKTKIIPLYKRPLTWISAAAAVVLVVITLNLDGPKPDVVSETVEVVEGLMDIPREDILAYVDENIEDFDIELIAEFIPENQLNDDYFDLEHQLHDPKDEDLVESISFDNITREDILEYLKDEDLDFSDLEDEDSFI